jgi:hypothetical protein
LPLITPGIKYTYLLKFTAITALLLFCSVANGQYRILDSIKYYVTTQKPTFLLELDGRNSFIREAPVTIDGVRAGLDFGNKVRLFIGAYWSRHKVSRTYTQHIYTPNERVVRQELSMFYVAPTLEYVVYNSKRWELAVPARVGFGKGNRKRYDATTGTLIEESRPGFVPLEFSFRAMYRITDWLNVSAGLGYRYAIFSSSVSDDFSAPHYTYGVGISPIKILKKLGVLEENNGKLQLKKP